MLRDQEVENVFVRNASGRSYFSANNWGLANSSLQTWGCPVSTSAAHLVVLGDVEMAEPCKNTKPCVSFFFNHVLVGTELDRPLDPQRQLFKFIRNHVTTQWKIIYFWLLPLYIKNMYYGTRDSWAEARQCQLRPGWSMVR